VIAMGQPFHLGPRSLRRLGPTISLAGQCAAPARPARLLRHCTTGLALPNTKGCYGSI
jgi:hypothetical protein